MAIKASGFARKSETSSEVPSSSLADIAFLLLIFFMVTTVFKTDSERPIEWPAAEATQKIDEKAKNILNVWVDSDGSVWMNDRPFAMTDVGPFVRPLYADSDRRLVISIRSDSNVPYRFIDQLQEQMVAAGVVRVVFATELERSMTRERR